MGLEEQREDLFLKVYHFGVRLSGAGIQTSVIDTQAG